MDASDVSWKAGADKMTFLQIDVSHGKKAIVIFVPVPLLPGFHKVQQRYALTRRPLLHSQDSMSLHT